MAVKSSNIIYNAIKIGSLPSESITEYIYTASRDNTVKKLTTDNTVEWTNSDHSDWLYSIAEWNGFVFSGARDNTMKKIDSNGNTVWTYSGISDQVAAMAVDSDGTIYAGGGPVDPVIHIVDQSGNFVSQFQTFSSGVTSIDIDKQGNVFVTSGNNSFKFNSSGVQQWTNTEHTANCYQSTIGLDGYFYTCIRYYNI